MKDKDKIINQYYLSINDIKTLLGISQSTAKKVFEKAYYEASQYKLPTKQFINLF